MQCACCWALFCLCVQKCPLQQELARQGAIPAVLRAMRMANAKARSHLDMRAHLYAQLEVQEAGCWVLRELATAVTSNVQLSDALFRPSFGIGSQVGRHGEGLEEASLCVKMLSGASCLQCHARPRCARGAEGWRLSLKNMAKFCCKKLFSILMFLGGFNVLLSYLSYFILCFFIFQTYIMCPIRPALRPDNA